MYILHHYPLCPFSRLVRVLLVEKQLSFKLIEEKPWERGEDLAKLNPAFELPVLMVEGKPICSIYAICEYLESISVPTTFFSNNLYNSAEIRRLVSWFNYKFYSEVTKYVFEEKIMLHFTGGSPRANFIRAARSNLSYHLDYIEFLLNSRKWLAGNNLSLADLTAAAQISTLDYLGDISWDKHQLTKEWYSVLKSRPSFRALLVERIRGFNPPVHYQNLDF